MRRLLLCVLISGLVASAPSAQPDVVPAEHGVYDLLAHARAGGLLPAYRHEVLPLGRGEVLRHLDSLGAQPLAPGILAWASAYRRELAPPPEAVHAWVGDGEAGALDLDAERFLAYSRSGDGDVGVWFEGGVQARQSEGPSVEGTPLAPEAVGGAALLPRLVLRGHWRDLVGVHSGTFNGLQVTGDTRVLQADPEVASLYYVGIAGQPPGSFDRSSASLRIRTGPFSAEIANERLRIGPSVADPLILSANADYFPFIRAGFERGPIRYQFVHGALSDQSRFVNDEQTFGIQGPERYLALHRLEGHTRTLSVGFTEMVVYGLRGPELAYLNPLFPIKPAEHALWDRDNSLFALDAVVRPLAGVEVYGTLLADDINFSRFGDEVGDNTKLAAQAGASVGGLLPGSTLFAEYTRIGPYVYTHRFREGDSFYNSYAHNGFGLGHPLGPNADQGLVGASTWLPGGVRARGLVRYARRGENPVDPETGEVQPVGGDVRLGREPDPLTNVFLAGDRFGGPGASLDVTWEPVRSLATRFQLDWQRWGPGTDRVFARLEAHLRL
jgi:hypothetical protein